MVYTLQITAYESKHQPLKVYTVHNTQQQTSHKKSGLIIFSVIAQLYSLNVLQEEFVNFFYFTEFNYYIFTMAHGVLQRVYNRIAKVV